MTRVTSLTIQTSGGGYQSVSSFMMLIDATLVNYKVSAQDLAAFGVHDVGACLYMTAVQTIPNITWGEITNFSSTLFDTGGWVHQTSAGYFQVPDDRWSYVQVGAIIYSHFGDSLRATIAVNSNVGSVGLPETMNDFTDTNTSDGLIAVNLVSGPVPCSSGDFFGVKAYPETGTAFIIPGSSNCFWIKGWA